MAEDSGRVVASPVAWVAITLAAAIASFAVVRPKVCKEVSNCDINQGSILNDLNHYAVAGLSTVFLNEVGSIWLAYRSSKPLAALIDGLMLVLLPSYLLCSAFFVLILENCLLPIPWLTHSALYGDTPVYTVIYLEWLINVPILIVLGGKCALGRSLDSVAGPVLISNLYIILSWSANFMSDGRLRWTAISLSFSMYGWASYYMGRWANEFRLNASISTPGRNLKPALVVALIVLFGIYGCVYLAKATGTISAEMERMLYTIMNIGSKLGMSIAFASIKVSAYNDMLVSLLVNTHIPFRRQSAMNSGDTEVALHQPFLDF